MVNENRFPAADVWRRDSDNYDSRRNPPPRYQRDSSRDRDRERDRGKDRDGDGRRDVGRDRSWDRVSGRAPNRAFPGQAERSRDRRPVETGTKGAPDGSTEQKSFVGGPVSKGPKTAQRSPASLRTVQSSYNEPRIPTKLDDVRSPTIKGPKTSDTKTRDYVASLLLALLRKSRDMGEHEHAKKSLDLLDKRREEQMRALSKKNDFPSLPELYRPKSEAERKRREVAEGNVDKTTKDLVSATKAFMSQLFAWRQPVAALEGDVNGLKARQDSMESKLQGQSLKTLEEDNARLRDEVTRLAGLVDDLSTKVAGLGPKIDSASSTSTNLESQVEQLASRSKIQASMIGGIEAKMTDHSANMAKIEAVDLEAMNNYITTEKPRQLEKLDKQEAAIAKLKTEMLAVRSSSKASAATERQPQGQQAEVHGAGSNPAPVPAPVASNHGIPSTTTAMVFPGDDFTSLRIEICKLNERILPLEKAPEKLEELQTRQTKAIALNSVGRNKLRDELRQELRNGWVNMAKTFGDLLDKETKDRFADSERLTELEKTVQRLHDHPASMTANIQNAPIISNTDAEMTEPTLEPFLSPVPEPLNSTGPAEPVEPIDPLLALPQASTQATGVGPAVESSQVEGGPDIQVLEKDIQLLQERMQYSEDEIRSVRVEFDGQCATLRMMVSTLDSQFNNLTTKDLYHAIIGHLEKLYPNARQLQEDMKSMTAQVHLMKQNNRTTNETIQKMEEIICGPVSQKRPLAGGTSNGGPVGDPSSTSKRQKTGGTPSGGNGSTNGSANGSANGAAVATATASS